VAARAGAGGRVCFSVLFLCVRSSWVAFWRSIRVGERGPLDLL
jgi:hypothetical protein